MKRCVSSSGSFLGCLYCRVALYSRCVMALWHSPQRPEGALMGWWTMALMEWMQTSSKAVMFTEASVVTEVLFLMWNESAHHGRDSISFCWKEAGPIKWGTNQFSSIGWTKRLPFISGGCLFPPAMHVKLATLVFWFRGRFRAALCFQVEPVFPDGGWWLCLSLCCSTD